MTTPEPFPEVYINGTLIKPEDMTPDLRNATLVIQRVQQNIIERYQRGELDLTESIEKYKAQKLKSKELETGVA